jgi:hypothetical protein
MGTVVAGIALIAVGLSGTFFRRAFVAMARSPSPPRFASRLEPLMRWPGWIAGEVSLVAIGVGVLAYELA